MSNRDPAVARPGAEASVPVAFATRFLQWAALGFMIPIANLLRMSKGLTLAELGFSAAILSGTVVALELPTGVLADRIGRKRTYVAALAFSLASCGALLLAEGFLAVTAALALYGVSRALSSGSLEALLIDRYIASKGEESLHRLMAAANAADTAGIALGSLAGGALPMLWESLFPGRNRYHGNVAAMAAASAILLVVVLVSVSEEGPSSRRKQALGAFVRESLATVRADAALGLLLATVMAWGFAISAIETYWQPRVASVLGSAGATWIFGLLSTGYFAAALLGSLASPLVIERTRIDPWVFLFALRLLSTAFVALLALQASVGGFAFFYLSMFLWNGMAGPPESTLLNLRIPSERRASLLSVASLAVQLGGLAGAVLFGAIVGTIGIGGAWMAAALVFGSSAPLYLVASRASRNPRSVGRP